MSATKFEALRLDGTVTTHTSFAAAKRASARSQGSRTVIEIRRAGWQPPHCNDAAGWDAARLAHGIANG
jgi:hypothetical protein